MDTKKTTTDAMVNAMHWDLKEIDLNQSNRYRETVKHPWEPQTCLGFLDRFLCFIADKIMKHPGANDGGIVTFTYEPPTRENGYTGCDRLIPEFQGHDTQNIEGWYITDD